VTQRGSRWLPGGPVDGVVRSDLSTGGDFHPPRGCIDRQLRMRFGTLAKY
jgi:hypothetical protein